MFFADEIVVVADVVVAVCRESRVQVEESLDRWRYARLGGGGYALGRGLKLIREKMEYI